LVVLGLVGGSFLAVLAPSQAAAGGSFHQCGSIPEKSLYGIRASGEDCATARFIAKEYQRSYEGSRRTVVRKWVCSRESYYDGINVKCKKRGPSDDEIRFAWGG